MSGKYKKVAYYPGCALEGTGHAYNRSTKELGKALGLELTELKNWNCCAFGAFLLVIAALILPLWPLLGWYWFLHRGGWMAMAVIAQALVLWSVLIVVRSVVAHNMGISRWYALTTPLGAAIFTAMMFTSTWKVLSGRGVTWKGRTYNPG